MLLTASDDYMEDTDVATITMCPEKQEHVDLSHFIAENKDSGGRKKKPSGADDQLNTFRTS